MEQNNSYDFIAIGVGPFNLGLAALTNPIKELNGLFIDRAETFDWHPGMMLESTTLQIPFLADLVTLADPTNPFSFLNYAKETGKIYSFYIRENFLLLRKEYNQYCNWVIQKLPNVCFGIEVSHIEFDQQNNIYVVETRNVSTNELKVFRTKKIVLGTGTTPFIPENCRDLKDRLIHNAHYLHHKTRIQSKKRITVVGSGQSAAEVFYDLLQDSDTYNYELNWITRSARFFPMEYTKLTLEMTSPEYVDYFYHLPDETREKLNKNQKNLYKGINQDLIAEIFNLLYTKQLDGDLKVSLRTNSELYQINEKDGVFELTFHQQEQNKFYRHETDEVILATGYHYQQPAFIEGIKDRINWDEKGRYAVSRDYTIDLNENEIFVQNAEQHTHGFVTPDLGMVAYRNSIIINQLLGREYYAVEKKIAFQQFEVNAEEEVFIDALQLQHES